MTALRYVATAAGVFLLLACGLLPPPSIVGSIDSTEEIGGGACPLLVTDGNGARWEVALVEPYMVSMEPDGRVLLWGPDGPTARTGERIRIVASPSRSEPSACRWGTAVMAEEITRAP